MQHERPIQRWRPHPWHGLSVGPTPPSIVNAFLEITPFDLVKYEIDKESGFLRVDRPQRTSALPPTPYGFIPRTLCGARVQDLMPGAVRGDGDPLDVCVISERPIDRAETLLTVRVVGGLPMLDADEADDKIIAILDGDNQWGQIRNLDELPPVIVERLQHYFMTYKWTPGDGQPTSLAVPYGRDRAERVVAAATQDYLDRFGESGATLTTA